MNSTSGRWADYLEHLVKLVDDCAEGASIATQTTWEKYPVAATYANLKHNAEGEASLLGIYDEWTYRSTQNPAESSDLLTPEMSALYARPSIRVYR